MNLAILGNGAWGSALADHATRQGHNVRMWGRLSTQGTTPDLAITLKDAEMTILAIPSHAMREVCDLMRHLLPPDIPLVSAAKGIEQATDLCMSEVIAEVSGRSEIAVLSGPTFASEIVLQHPSALVCASHKQVCCDKVQGAFNSPTLRVYTSTDVRGVELGGALKNVMAIAAGVCAGLGYGDNTKAALITRGLSEMQRIGVALGGQAQTFSGLSGVGDLILTCSSIQSRNFQVGYSLGRGESIEEILKKLKGTAEGVKTSKSVYEILQTRHIAAPILQEVYHMLHEAKPPREAVQSLMNREPGKEFEI